MGNSYLNFFKITDIPLEGTYQANLSVSEIASLISEKKTLFLSNASRVLFSQPVIVKNVKTGETMEFPSIVSIVNKVV